MLLLAIRNFQESQELFFKTQVNTKKLLFWNSLFFWFSYVKKTTGAEGLKWIKITGVRENRIF